ncbi:MAG: FG-GAP-like repeat-containing protein [Pirellulales bacterium]
MLRVILAIVPLLICVPAHAGGLAFRRHVVNADATFSACAALDVNHDGKLDIVSGGFWYESPNWQRHVVRDVEIIRGRYDGFAHQPLDVNADGWTDIVEVNYRSRSIKWIEHPGQSLGRWTAHVVAEPGPMETGRLADIDGDGRLDLLPNGVRDAAWWELLAPGESDASGPQWVRHELPREVAGHGIGFGDIDGDGRGDIVGPSGWLQAPEDRRGGRWRWHAEFDLGSASIPILVVDVDADGDADLVFSRAHGFGLYWCEQSTDEAGQRAWIRHAIDTSWSQAHSPLWADLDGDGRGELIVGKRYLAHEGADPGAYDPLIVCRYQFDPKARTWTRGLLSWAEGVGLGLDPKVVDLDADGDLDLVAAGRSGLYWLENLLEDPAATSASVARYANMPEYSKHAQLLQVKTESAELRPVTTPFDWGLRRAHILAGLERAAGPLPDPSQRVPLDVELVETRTENNVNRRKVRFATEPGRHVAAQLLVPAGLRGKAPAVLCLSDERAPGAAGEAGEPDASNPEVFQFAVKLAERGYVALVPDDPWHQETGAQPAADSPRHASGTSRAIWNNLRAVDLLESLSEVDAERIGCLGHGAGGELAVMTAAFDQRLVAIVTSCGITSLAETPPEELARWSAPRRMPRIATVYENDPAKLPFDFHELVAALAPRPVYVMAPLHDLICEIRGARNVLQAAAEVYNLHNVPQNLHSSHPDTGRELHEAEIDEALAWLDRQLRPER